MTPTKAQPTAVAQRVAELDSTSVVADLDNVGVAR